MKPLLIIKTGTAITHDQGDFEDWIAATAGFVSPHYQTCSVHKGETLPLAASVSGVVITGSAAMVSDRLPWSEYAADWLRDVATTQLPVLGICFGHQLLAHALGGSVGYHPNGREIGTTFVTQTSLAQADPLFSGLPERFPVQVSHMQSVLQLPGGAQILASNEFEKHQAVRFNKTMWGVQFHPEFSSQVMLAYLEARAANLQAEGQSLDALRERVSDTPEAVQLLQNFGRQLPVGLP